VDIHTHILPSLDDGARDEREAVRMLQIAVDDGIGALVATPHAHHTQAERVLRAVEQLNALALAREIPVEILPGQEARLSSDLITECASGTHLTLNQRGYVLVEWPFTDHWPAEVVERATERLLDAGLPLVLAHPERSRVVQHNPAVLEWLVERGVVIQLNASSLTGYEGERAQQVAELLLHRRMAHVIASDAHNADRRAPRISFAYDVATRLSGQEHAAWMRAVPHALIAGRPVTVPRPIDPVA
jgi:protein-tyrosine phosphatase